MKALMKQNQSKKEDMPKATTWRKMKKGVSESLERLICKGGG